MYMTPKPKRTFGKNTITLQKIEFSSNLLGITINEAYTTVKITKLMAMIIDENRPADKKLTTVPTIKPNQGRLHRNLSKSKYICLFHSFHTAGYLGHLSRNRRLTCLVKLKRQKLCYFLTLISSVLHRYHSS